MDRDLAQADPAEGAGVLVGRGDRVAGLIRDQHSVAVVERSITGADGTVMVFKHDFPDAVQHHYSPAGTNQDVLLYRGECALPGDGRVFDGDIRRSEEHTSELQSLRH